MHLNRTDPGFCDPVNNFDADMNRGDAICFLFGFIGAFYFLAYLLLLKSSTRYDWNC